MVHWERKEHVVRSSVNWDLRGIGDISRDKLGKNMRELTVFMDSDVRQIGQIIKKYAPLEMLKLSTWDRWRFTDEGNPFAASTASAFVRFLQNAYVLADTFGVDAIHSERNISERDYKRLASLFDDLVKRTQRYVDNLALLAGKDSGITDRQIATIFQDIASARATALTLRLLPFQTAVGKAYHAGLNGLVQAFATLEKSSMGGIRRLREDSDSYKHDMDQAIAESKALGQTFSDDQDRIDMLVRKNGWADRIDSLLNRRDGYGLYDVQALTGLDNHDCEALSLDLGSVVGTYSQYPFEDRPTAQFPFIHGVTKYFCFDTDHLLDDAYEIVKSRVISEGILSAEDWEKAADERRDLRLVTLVHTIFGSDGFTMHQDGLTAVYDFGGKSIGLLVVPPLAHDVFTESAGAMEELRNDLMLMGKASGRNMPVLVIDGTSNDFYRMEESEGAVSVTYPQLAGMVEDAKSRSDLAQILGIVHVSHAPLEQEADSSEEAQEETAVAEGTQTSEPQPAEPQPRATEQDESQTIASEEEQKEESSVEEPQVENESSAPVEAVPTEQEAEVTEAETPAVEEKPVEEEQSSEEENPIEEPQPEETVPAEPQPRATEQDEPQTVVSEEEQKEESSVPEEAVSAEPETFDTEAETQNPVEEGQPSEEPQPEEAVSSEQETEPPSEEAYVPEENPVEDELPSEEENPVEELQPKEEPVVVAPVEAEETAPQSEPKQEEVASPAEETPAQEETPIESAPAKPEAPVEKRSEPQQLTLGLSPKQEEPVKEEAVKPAAKPFSIFTLLGSIAHGEKNPSYLPEKPKEEPKEPTIAELMAQQEAEEQAEAATAEPEPVKEETPVAEPEPVKEETPVAEPEPVKEETPVTEPESVKEETPVAEPESVKEETPVA